MEFESTQDSVEITEQPDNVESVETNQDVDAPTSEPIESEETNKEVTVDTESTNDIDTIKVGGEEYTLDEIREFKQGYLRQSDYTKKTQEIARQREEYKEAIELYEYLKSNPYALEALKSDEYIDPNIQEKASQLTPEMQKIRELEMHIAQKDLDNEISNLKEKYSDFDEVKVLQEAEKRGITDLEFVYKALRDDDKVDTEKIKREAVEEAKREIMSEIAKNKDITKTLIGNESEKAQAKDITLTPAQRRVANGMGLSEAEYAEWLNK